MDESKKIQVVVLRSYSDSLELLRLQTNYDRGSFFQNVTGSVEAGEKFIDAAVREVYEELGFVNVIITSLDLTFYFKNRFNKNVHEECFLLLLDSPKEVTLSLEHQSFEWKPCDHVTKDDFKFISNYEAFMAAYKLAQKR